uniref:Protein kinase domain-containing protein n=1 Tax=Setaria viridis TaxID=4556 RepID=A0A4U6UJF0_SETVI|nr:hypothetical protein SEVIR_5G136700v2 [Setaria viridis]
MIQKYLGKVASNVLPGQLEDGTTVAVKVLRRYDDQGLDHETAPPPLWISHMKIALEAARAFTYLHEDSSPGVIHRDFKSSNILLEHDFTAKCQTFD